MMTAMGFNLHQKFVVPMAAQLDLARGRHGTTYPEALWCVSHQSSICFYPYIHIFPSYPHIYISKFIQSFYFTVYWCLRITLMLVVLQVNEHHSKTVMNLLRDGAIFMRPRSIVEHHAQLLFACRTVLWSYPKSYIALTTPLVHRNKIKSFTRFHL